MADDKPTVLTMACGVMGDGRTCAIMVIPDQHGLQFRVIIKGGATFEIGLDAQNGANLQEQIAAVLRDIAG
jgi:hypothetical protein